MIAVLCPVCHEDLITQEGELEIGNATLLQIIICDNCEAELEIISTDPIKVQVTDDEEDEPEPSDEIDDLLKGEDRDEEEE